jgi:NADPH:quinone reductase-like Zn-dependent oxidoreductase
LKAVRVHGAHGRDRLRYQDTEDPQLRSPGDVIVKLKAAAVNRIDLTDHGDHIPGVDGAGTVTAVGADVSSVKAGDDVCIDPVLSCDGCEFCAKDQGALCCQRRLLSERDDGTYAEYVRVPAKNCWTIPIGLSFEEAAAFPLAYTTVWRMLFTHADLKPGETVLIIGAGGIGSAALQLATAIGARVFIASRSDGKLAAAAKYGAEHAINCRTHDLAGEVRRLTGKRGVDVAVNSAGGETWSAGLAALARGGRLAACGTIAGAHPKTDLRRIFWNQLRVSSPGFATAQEFRRVVNFFNRSCRRPVIDRIFSLKDVARAHERMRQGEAFGKIILRMDD